MKIYLRILNYILPYKINIILYVAFTFFAIIFGLVSFITIIPLLKVIFESGEDNIIKPVLSYNPAVLIDYLKYWVNLITGELGKIKALAFICIFAIIATFMKNFFFYFSLRNLAVLRTNVLRDMRNEMFEKINYLQISYYKRRKKGDLISRMTNDVQEIENSIISTLNIIFREPLTIIIFYIMLFGISWKLTIMTIILLPVSGFIIGRIAKKLKEQSTAVQDSLGKILSIIDETISGTRIIKAFNAQKYMIHKFTNENNNYSRLFKSIVRKRELASPLSEFLGVSVITFIIWYGGVEIFNSSSSLAPEDFIGYIIIYTQILTPAKAFSSAYSLIQRGIASGERIFNLIDAPVTIKNNKRCIPVRTFEKNIDFKNVSFAYENDYTLENINISIPKGKIIALVGPSGSGKTTLADLIPRYHDPLKGEILIDNIPLTDYDISQLRGLMGIVTQEAILFNDTIFNNIAFATPHAKEEDVINAAKIANAHDFIINFPQGYHTNIGDRGQRLSGGEKQRISIARAILKNPPILILDEATSSLDAESEQLVQEAIYKLMENRTCVVIAHRLSTIKHADEIVVIDNGVIVQTGTHEELINIEGVYQRLNRIQEIEK